MKSQGQLKKISIIFLVALFLGGVFVLAGGLDSFGNDKDKFPILDLNSGKQIDFTWTDDNTKEELIIYSDKKTYQGFTSTVVYLAINNTKDKQWVTIKPTKKSNWMEYYTNSSREVETKHYDEIKYKCTDPLNKSKTTTCINKTYSHSTYKTEYFDNWTKLNLQNNVLTINKIDEARLDSKYSTKLKTIDNEYAKEKIRFNLPKGITYLRYERENDYSPEDNKQEEFFIEVFGDTGNYGHLDPFNNASWLRKANLTIDSSKVSGSSNLSNFTALLTEDNMPSEIWQLANADGGDIRFATDSTGDTELAREIVSYSNTTNTTEIYVKVPNVDYSANTTIWIFYDYDEAEDYDRTDTYGSDNAWNSNYRGVYHFEDNASDSTSNNEDGTNDGGTYTSGEFGKGMSFDGTSKVTLPDDCFDDISNGTLQFWSKPTSSSTTYQMIGATAFYKIIFGQYNSAPYIQGYTSPNDAWKMDEVTLTTNFGSHVWESNGSAWNGWFNGTSKSLSAIAGSNSGKWFDDASAGTTVYTIGRAYSLYYTGILDEVRFLENQLSSDWISTEYNNQNEPSTFWGTGTPEDNSVSSDNPPTYSNINTNETIAGNLASFNITVDDDTALETNGQYIFSTNNTGTWVNESAINFTATPQTVNTLKTLNSTVGDYICYKWYLTDNNSNMNITEETCLTTTIGTDNDPYFTFIPANQTLTYLDSLLVNFTASDDTSIDTFFINWTDYFSINSTGTLINYSILPVGIYEINVSVNDTSGNTNQTAYRITVNQDNSDCGVWYNESSPITFGTPVKILTDCTSAYTLKLNNSIITNNSEHLLGGGLWNASVQRTDTVNYTNVYDESLLLINQADNIITLTISPSTTETYPTETTTSCSATDGTPNFYRDNVSVSNPEIITLDVGVYEYRCNISESQNYTSNSSIDTLTINQNSSSCGIWLNDTSPITYGEQVVVYTNCSSDYSMYLNGSSIANASTHSLGGGVYNFSVQRTDTSNYSENYNEMELTVDKATTSLSVSGTSPITYGTAGDVTGTGCPTQLTCNLYRNDTGSVSNPDTTVLDIGAYLYEYNTTGNENYTLDSDTFTLIVNKDNSNCNVLFNETSPQIFGVPFLVWSDCDSAFTLMRNGSTITNNSEQSLAVGVYNFSVQRTDTENYTNVYDESEFVITTSISTKGRLLQIWRNATSNLNVSWIDKEGNWFTIGDINSSGNVYDNNNRVCTAENGLCSGSDSWNRSGTDVYLANSGDNVGIGTTTPQSLLNLDGTYDAAGGLSFGDGDTGIYEYADDVLILRVGGATAAQFRANTFKAVNWRVPSSNNDMTIWGAQSVGQTDAALAIGNEYNLSGLAQPVLTVHNYRSSTAGTEVFRVNGDGNVGIGTTTPRSGLDVSDNDIYIGNHPTSNKLFFGNTANYFTRGEIHTTQTNLGLYNDYTSGYITLNTDTAGEVIRISDTGNVGIGTTTPQNTLNVIGDSNITGNFTGNQIYGEMWNYTSAGLTFDIDDADVYYNYTGFKTGYVNGFTFEENTQANGGDKLVAQVDGLYKISFSMSFSSQANGGLFGISLHHDYNPDTHRNCYARREAATDTGNVGIECFMDLEVGEKVGMMIENENSARDISVETINLNIMRVGDIV